MKLIKLTQGKFALVDNEDYEYLNQFHWSVDGSGYPQRATKTEKGWRPRRMHRDILGLVGSETSDHKDLDKLNNQRSNLRRCNKADNNRNRALLRNNTSGYVGVHWNKGKKKWQVNIHVNNKKIYLGRSHNIKEAAFVYNQAAKQYFGEFARLNPL